MRPQKLSEKERGSQQESMLKEICTMVAERCINSQSKRPVTVGVVERALAELHYNVDRCVYAYQTCERRA